LTPGVYHGFDGAAPGSSVTIAYKSMMFAALSRALSTALRPDFISLITPTDGPTIAVKIEAVERKNEGAASRLPLNSNV
jgi:hypothetical protein